MFRHEWQNLRAMFETDRAFCRYVERTQRDAGSLRMRPATEDAD